MLLVRALAVLGALPQVMARTFSVLSVREVMRLLSFQDAEQAVAFLSAYNLPAEQDGKVRESHQACFACPRPCASSRGSRI